MAAHAILSPSSAYRWLACTPSARFEEQIPEEKSAYSAEGTLAHALGALLLSARSGTFKGNQYLFNSYLDAMEKEIVAFYLKISAPDPKGEFRTMYDYAEEWAAFIVNYGGTILIEQSYDISAYVPLGFGTADATNITPTVLYVTDFKYGAGVKVPATGNKQLMLYGVGALVKAVELGHKPETVVLTIFQPRAGGVSSWEISVAELLTWAEMEVKPKALLAIAGQGEFVPGGHCQFCKARTMCRAFYNRFAEVRKLSDKRVLTQEDLVTVLTYGPLLKTWINKVEEDAVKQLSARKTIPGFKLVNGRGKRQFRNEDNVVDILVGADFSSDQIFTPSLRSLTDLEKALGPKRFNILFADEIITTAGKPQIAPEDDDRPAIGSNAADEYDDDLI